MTDAETASVSIDVAPLVPIAGRGDIKFLTSAEVMIAGISWTLHGITIRQDRRSGRMTVHLPGYRCPRRGTLEAAVTLPSELARAIGEQVLLSVPAGTLVRVPTSENAK
jgi:hypothetical protein